MKKTVKYDFEKLTSKEVSPEGNLSMYSTFVERGSDDDILNTRLLHWLKDDDLGITGENEFCRYSKKRGSTAITHKEFLKGLKLNRVGDDGQEA